MKATIKWVYRKYDRFTERTITKRYQKTFEVEKNEPNYIVDKARDNCYLGAEDFITTIKCGRYEYQWFGYPNY